MRKMFWLVYGCWCLLAVAVWAMAMMDLFADAPALDMKKASTMEAFNEAQMAVHGKGRTIKKTTMYYKPGSARCFTLVNTDDGGFERVWFDSRKDAKKWGEGKHLIWQPLTPLVEKQLASIKAKTVKYLSK